MSRELWDQSGGTFRTLQSATSQHIAGATFSLTFQRNEIHGDLTTIHNNYSGGYYPGWKPSRRCAALDFGRLSRHFCGRDRELEQLDSVFKVGEGSVRCAIEGISGLGKSHLAIKYGKTSFESEKYTHVFWISADTDTKLLGGLESVLVKLDHPAQFESDQKTKVEVVRRWLEDADEDQRWLLIFDNARRECFETMRNNLPNNTPHGHILLTTQFEDLAKGFVSSQLESLSLLRLQPLTIDDGVSLLIASSEMVSDDLSNQDREKACRLVQRTGCHPLAITFAAACATTASSLPDLLRQTSTDQLVMITEHEDTLADTDQRVIKQFFDRQIAHIQDDPLALDLFRILSFLDNASVSVQMLWRGIQFSQAATSGEDSTDKKARMSWRDRFRFLRKLARHSSSSKKNPDRSCGAAAEQSSLSTCRMSELQKSIQTLVGQNLIQVTSPGVVSMHDLTNYLSLRSMEAAEVSSRYQDHTCLLIYSALISIEDPSHRDNWLASDEVVAHVFKISSTSDYTQSGLDVILCEAAFYLQSRGRYSDSQTLNERLLALQKLLFGPIHPSTLWTTLSVGNMYKLQGRLPEAEKLYLGLLEDYKKLPEPMHIGCLATMNNLALLYQNQGRNQEAEDLYQDALEEARKLLGPTHPNTLTLMANLALVYESRSQYRELEMTLERVLFEERQQLGPKHPNVLSAMHNLAGAYYHQGRYREAEALFQKVLDEKREQLGHTHPTTLGTVHSLALVYQSQDRHQEAENSLQLVVDGMKNQLGPTHPDTLESMHSLASVYDSQERFREAEDLFQLVLDARKKRLGPTHLKTLMTINDLALVFQSEGRIREAEELFQHVLDEGKKHLGPMARTTLTIMQNLAMLYLSQDRYQEAEKLFQHVLGQEKDLLGPTHPNTLVTMHNLAAAYKAQSRFEEAEEPFQHVLDESRKQLDPTHPRIMNTMANLISVYVSQGRFGEAEELCQQALDERRKERGSTHPSTLQAMGDLAGVYYSQGRYKDAEEIFHQELDGRKQQFGLTHARSLTTMHKLALVKDLQGHFREAEELYRHTLEEQTKQLGSRHRDTLSTVHHLATMLESEARFIEAEELLQSALAGGMEVYGPDHEWTVAVREDLDRVHEKIASASARES